MNDPSVAFCHGFPGSISARAVERDTGRRVGLTTDGRQRLTVLKRENRELKRATEILRKASAFFTQAELDRRPMWWWGHSLRWGSLSFLLVSLKGERTSAQTVGSKPFL